MSLVLKMVFKSLIVILGVSEFKIEQFPVFGGFSME